MALVKLLCRYSKDVDDEATEEINNELYIISVNKGDKFNENEERAKLVKEKKAYDYGPMVFNLRDVSKFNHIDNNHTHIRFYGEPMGYTFKINHMQFEVLYQSLLGGMMINDFTQLQEVKPKINGKSKRTKNGETGDD